MKSPVAVIAAAFRPQIDDIRAAVALVNLAAKSGPSDVITSSTDLEDIQQDVMASYLALPEAAKQRFHRNRREWRAWCRRTRQNGRGHQTPKGTKPEMRSIAGACSHPA